MGRPHLIPARTATSVRLAAQTPAWQELSAALTEATVDFANRDDLIVICAPGAGSGAPGCFYPDLATIEIDGTHLGVDPATCDPTQPADRNRYPAVWGVLIHESAHAAHTRWRPPEAAQQTAAATKAAILLEDTRIEAAQARRRPADAHWLRACAAALIVPDFTPRPAGNPQTSADQQTTSAQAHAAMDPWTASTAAALICARADAHILTSNDAAPVTAAVEDILGRDRLDQLQAIWRLAHKTADDDEGAMMELGRRWCSIVGVDPDQPPPAPDTDTVGTPLAKAINATLEAVVGELRPELPGVEETTIRRAAHQQARKAFPKAIVPAPTPGSPIARTRPPSTKEQAAARQLARTLRAAGHRERATVVRTSPTPPGRLRMRDVLTGQAQRAAGAVPTVEPFTQTTHRYVPNPPLRVGIACDISRSMRRAARPIASAAWILARAVAHVPDAQSATVLFGQDVYPLTYPGRIPARVNEFATDHYRHHFREAVGALDGALNLTAPGAARLLVIVSDGYFEDDQRTVGQHRITRLTASRCPVLWLCLDAQDQPMDGTFPVHLTNPATAIDAIAHAATRVLRNAM